MQISLQHISLAIALIGCVLGYFSYRKKQFVPTEIVELKEELGKVQGDIQVLQKQVSLFWNLAERQMSQLLHSPHRPRLDKLLDKNLRGEELTQKEAVQLVDLLQKLIDSKVLDGNEVSWAVWLMAVTVGKYNLPDPLGN